MNVRRLLGLDFSQPGAPKSSPRFKRRVSTVPRQRRAGFGRSFRSAFRLALREPKLLASVAVLILLEAAAGGAAILFIKEFLQKLLQAGSSRAVIVAAAVFLVIWICKVLSGLGARIGRFQLARAIELHARVQVLHHLMLLSVGFLENHSRAELIQRVNNDTSSLRDSLTALVNAVSASVRLATLFAVAVAIDPVLCLISFLTAPLVVPVMVAVGRRVEASSMKHRQSQVKLVDLLMEVLNGIRTIKAYNAVDREREFHRDACRMIYTNSGRMQAWQAGASAVPELAIGIGAVVIVVVGGLRLVEGSMDWPAFMTFIIALIGMQPPFTTLTQSISTLQERQPYADRYFELLAIEPEVKDPADPLPVPSGAPSIEFKDVSYSAGGQNILRGVSFRIEPGEIIGIVGPTGAGKTTIANLAVRFVDPARGTVHYHDSDIRRYRQVDLASELALVTQNAFLFASDVATNIAYGRPDLEMTHLRAAAEAAAVLEEIDAMPDGFATRIGLGGRAVSGGQAQRIAIARAFARDASLLILDEATSALDIATETRVIESIKRHVATRDRTVLMISHRASALQLADKILVLERGRVAGFAPHDELLQTCRIYRQMFEHAPIAAVMPQRT